MTNSATGRAIAGMVGTLALSAMAGTVMSLDIAISNKR